jgi:hypothetical protein
LQPVWSATTLCLCSSADFFVVSICGLAFGRGCTACGLPRGRGYDDRLFSVVEDSEAEEEERAE